MCNYKFDTLQLHAGQQSDKSTGAIAIPIYQTTAYDFQTIEHAGNLFALKEPGYIYTRLNNPTVDAFEQRIAALEGGSAAVATASGMSAEFLTIATLCNSGDNIVSSAALYGGTYNQFKQTLKKLGITVKFPKKDIPAGIEDVDAGNARIFASNGKINVVADAQTSIIIYSANGMHVASLEASNASVAVTPGFYIVKVGNQVAKLAVK